ncbi:MAG: Ig-like domain-containing protein [bacterium]|nr:Ig-like domain-containing protein [bacterium]
MIWSSSDTKVATVDNKGLIKAVKEESRKDS